jgi:hypothetical protein
VNAARAARSNGGTVVLDPRLPDQARGVIEITGLQSLIQVD